MATQSGFATVSRALQKESINATERAELLAVPLLLLVLLLVFRSVVAAAIPLAFGALTVFAGRGVFALLSSVMTIDAISLVVCTMMGLALGVDYSLLIVSRFREELEAGRDPYEAALRARASAGRTTLFAGVTLIVAVLGSAFCSPARCCSRWRRRSASPPCSASSSRRWRCRRCWRCSASGSTPGGSGAPVAPAWRRPASRPRRPRRCAAPASPRA